MIATTTTTNEKEEDPAPSDESVGGTGAIQQQQEEASPNPDNKMVDGKSPVESGGNDNKFALPDEFAAVKLKRTPKPVMNSEVAEPATETAPSYATFQLKSTGQGDKVKSGKDIVKEKNEDIMEESGGLPGEFASVQLKKASTPTKSEVAEPATETTPSYATFQLKSTGLGDKAKRGKNVVKEENEDTIEESGGLPDEFASVQLKKASTPTKSEIPEPATETAPSYATFQLKATGQGEKAKRGKNVVKEENEDKNDEFALPSEFSTVQLKKAPATRKPEIEEPPVDLSPSYATFQLKATGQGDKVKSGKDVVKEGNEGADAEGMEKPSFARVNLKKSGLGDAIMAGGDVVKQQQHGEEDARFSLPDEFSCFQLKKAKVKPVSVTDEEEEKPAYAAVQLRKAETVQHEVEATEFAVPGLKFAKVHHNPEAALPEEEEKPAYVAVQLKKAAAVEHKAEVEVSDGPFEPAFAAPVLKSAKVPHKAEVEIAKEERPGDAYADVAVHLKKADTVEHKEVVIFEEEDTAAEDKPEPAAVQLKKAEKVERSKAGGAEVETEKSPKPEFAAPVLKSAAAPRKTDFDIREEKRPEDAYAAVKLKKTDAAAPNELAPGEA